MANTKSRRNADGLTEKMVQALPELAVATSVRQGALRCHELKIVNIEHFYHEWMSDDAFRKALVKAREAHQGDVRQRVREVAVLSAENAVVDLVVAAQEGAKPGQVHAIKNLLLLAGLDELSSRAHVEQQVTVYGAQQDLKTSLGTHLARLRATFS